MTNADALAIDEHPDHVEAVCLEGASMAIDPRQGRTTQLLLLPPVDRLDGMAEADPAPGLDLDERNRAVTLDDEIDIAMADAKSALDHFPTGAPKPPLRDLLPQLPKVLRDR